MREGVAVSSPSSEADDRSNVIPFPERGVAYTGPALKLMTGLAKAVLELDEALNDHDRALIRPKIKEMMSRVYDTMAIVEEHMDALDEHKDVIHSFIENGDVAYFSNGASSLPMEVISFFERRQTMLMVGRLYFKRGDTIHPLLDQDNDHQTLLAHDGLVACKWPRTP